MSRRARSAFAIGNPSAPAGVARLGGGRGSGPRRRWHAAPAGTPIGNPTDTPGAPCSRRGQSSAFFKSPASEPSTLARAHSRALWGPRAEPRGERYAPPLAWGTSGRVAGPDGNWRVFALVPSPGVAAKRTGA